MSEIKRNIPPLFTEHIAEVDSGLANELTHALATTEPVTSVRHNIRKGVAPSEGADRVPWCEMGEYLAERPQFTFMPELHQGRFYVQDASSMFIGYAIRQLTGDEPVSYLDACAAPGGKTTAAIDALPWGSHVVANEFVGSRAAVLRENLAKWGCPYATVTQGDTRQFREHPERFDIIAADVPCSGEGMMRKDPEAVAQWSLGLVGQCAARQREILDNLWGALKPGGYMIYSTCTFNVEENESMIEYLRDSYGAESVEIATPEEWGIAGASIGEMPACRFMPQNLRGEGLFMAVVRKPASDAESGGRGKAKKAKAGKAPKIPDVSHWLKGEYDATLESDGENIWATPGGFSAGDALRPRTLIGVIKGKSVVPTQELAMSEMLNAEAFGQWEVDKATALQYLRHEAVTLDDAAPRGVILLVYGRRPLGFVKNLGNRANNLYPSAWRILSRGQ